MMTDPTGFFFKYLMKKLNNFMGKWGTVIASTIAAAFIPGFWGGFIAGFIGSGGDIKAGLVGGVGAFSFGVMHNWQPGGFGVNFTASLAKSIAHGAVGGISSMALGGKFKDGFMGSFASQGFEQLGGYTKLGLNKNVSGAPQRLHNAIASAVIGGTASVIGGGKFANGAVSGAFSRMFNDVAKDESPKEYDERINAKYDALIDKVHKISDANYDEAIKAGVKISEGTGYEWEVKVKKGTVTFSDSDIQIGVGASVKGKYFGVDASAKIGVLQALRNISPSVEAARNMKIYQIEQKRQLCLLDRNC